MVEKSPKILLALKICKRAANVISFDLENLELRMDVTEAISQMGRQK